MLLNEFEFWICWRRLLRAPWIVRRSNQSILNEINPEYLLKGPMLKPKLQQLVIWCKEPTYWKRPWSWRDWRQEEKGATEDKTVGWHHWFNEQELSKFWDIVKDREAWHATVHGVTKIWTWPSTWTELTEF